MRAFKEKVFDVTFSILSAKKLLKLDLSSSPNENEQKLRRANCSSHNSCWIGADFWMILSWVSINANFTSKRKLSLYREWMLLKENFRITVQGNVFKVVRFLTINGYQYQQLCSCCGIDSLEELDWKWRNFRAFKSANEQ